MPVQPGRSTGPSGIAQLRQQSLDHETAAASAAPSVQPHPFSDAMNLDDFIVPGSVGSPSGLPPSPPSEATIPSGHAVASAIPIKGRAIQDQSHPTISNVVPASVPNPPHDQRQGEFGYVQRRVRKTSIDEGNVGCSLT